MEPNADLYQQVTDAVLAAMDRGVIPWQQPWHVDAKSGKPTPPANLISRRPYRGTNLCLLALTEYASPYWLTFKQAQDAGGHVKRGEKSTLIVFWKIQSYPDKDQSEKTVSIPLLRYFRVFNSEQCDGLSVPTPEAPAVNTWDAIAAAEAMLAGMPDPPTFAYGGSRACYYPGRDHIDLPERKAFPRASDFYATAFHEMTHATGHLSRLSRDEINGKSVHPFGSEPYGREELVAEMGAAFLCAQAGIDHVETSAAYLEGWRRAIRADRKLITLAAGRAQKAADFITGAILAPED